MIEKTMTRQQLFKLGNLDWATNNELERAQEMKSIYIGGLRKPGVSTPG